MIAMYKLKQFGWCAQTNLSRKTIPNNTILHVVRTLAIAAAIASAMGLLLPRQAEAQEESALTVSTDEQSVHIFPTVSKSAELASIAPFPPGPLTYHGGPVMTKATTYAIFWVPPALQNGAATSMSAHYQNVQKALLKLYPGHGIDNNNTQYYMTKSSGLFSQTLYIQNAGGLVKSIVDTTPYPASGCSDSHTPGNCLTDAQIKAEIQNVMTANGWTGGLNKMFLLYTSSGEGSCAGIRCAYQDYCAYHGYFLSGSTPVIYGNEPYAAADGCQLPGASSPNSDPAADAAASITSHELTEAITDPELNAWYAGDGEIADLCAWNYGANTWDSGKANQSWPISVSPLGGIRFFELQQEYDNHSGGCVQVGP